MERGHSTLYTLLSVLCLGLIVYVVGQKYILQVAPPGAVNILGLTTNSQGEQPNFTETALNSAKGIAAQKAKELEKSLVSSAQKEVGELTKSQLDHLKRQICRDWGVLPEESTSSSQL